GAARRRRQEHRPCGRGRRERLAFPGASTAAQERVPQRREARAPADAAVQGLHRTADGRPGTACAASHAAAMGLGSYLAATRSGYVTSSTPVALSASRTRGLTSAATSRAWSYPRW